jgi:hypothetical protein
VAARPEGPYGLSIVEKHGGLAFSDHQLCSVFDVCGAGFRQPVDQLFSGIVKPFQQFQKNDVVGTHGIVSLHAVLI